MAIEALFNPLAAWLGPGFAAILLLGVAFFMQYNKTSKEKNSTFYEQQKNFYDGLYTQNKDLTKELVETRSRLDAQYDAFHGMARYAHFIRHFAHDLMQVCYSAGRLNQPPPKRELPPVPSMEEAADWQAPKIQEKENHNGQS